MGPTGTGKTETAQTISKCPSVELVRFDMSEYRKTQCSKTDPPPYVGHEDTSGILIEKLQEHPTVCYFR